MRITVIVLSVSFLSAGVVTPAGVVLAAPATAGENQEKISDLAGEIEEHYGVTDDQSVQERVAAIGAKIAAVTGGQYRFRVLKGEDINAFTIPGGYVYVMQGLLDYMRTDDEVAAIIAHEIAHNTQGHIARQMPNSFLLMIAAMLLGQAGMAPMALSQTAAQWILAGYSRDDEREADNKGCEFLIRAKLDPYGALVAMQRLSDHDRPIDYGLYASHPETSERIALLADYLTRQNVRPVVKQSGDGRQFSVVDEGLILTPISADDDGYGPMYRAYLMAGRLWQIRQRDALSPDLVVVDQGPGVA
ncbi:MAG: M48 family metalloprotease, partial [Negativicutes bacterium]|nr:M48 family metalloprotease [Negativicutes bacterium]